MERFRLTPREWISALLFVVACSFFVSDIPDSVSTMQFAVGAVVAIGGYIGLMTFYD